MISTSLRFEQTFFVPYTEVEVQGRGGNVTGPSNGVLGDKSVTTEMCHILF